MFKVNLFQTFHSLFSINCLKNINQSLRFASNIASNYYAVLGIEPRSSDDKVKEAYYELSKKYHPDKNFGDDTATQKILEINEAFEVLGNKAEKEKYDEKFFPLWRKPEKRSPSFIYEHQEYYEEPVANRIFRRSPSAMELRYQEYKKYTKGEKKRKNRHATQKACFQKYMVSNHYSRLY